MADLSSLSDAQLTQLYQSAVANQAIAQNESGNAPVTANPTNPTSTANSSMQVVQGTRAQPGFGVTPSNGTPEDTAREGRDLRGALEQHYGNPDTAALAYNWGSGNTDKWIAAGSKLSDLPDDQLKYLYNYKQNVAKMPEAQAPPQLGTGPSPVAYGSPDATPSASQMPANWQPPGSVTMGIGDTLGGATRAIVHGLGKAANWIAPDSSFATQAAQAEQQIDATRAAENARYAAQQAPQQPLAQMVRNAIGAPAGAQPDVGRAVGRALPALAIPTGAPSSILGAAGMGAGAGALMGAAGTQPGQSYPAQIGLGAAAGAVGGGITGAAGRVIAGAPVSPAVRDMMNQGVVTTPGQTLGGIPNWLEQQATSIPIVGPAIARARTSAVQDANTALANQVLAPVGVTVPKGIPTRDLISTVGDRISAEYDRILPQTTFKVDTQLKRDMTPIYQQVATMPPDIQNAFQGIMDRNFGSQIRNGQMSGQIFKDADSVLGREAANFSGSADAFQRNLGGVLRDTQNTLRDALERTNPNVPTLGPANQAWRNYTVLRNAGARVNNPDMPIQPGQMQAAVKAGDTSVGKGNFAKGQANLQGFTDNAVSALGSTVADSGTAGRSALLHTPEAILGLAGAALAGHPLPAALAGLGAGAGYAAYGTNAGRQTMLALLARRPQFMRSMGQGMLSGAPAAGGAAASMTSNRTADQQ